MVPLQNRVSIASLPAYMTGLFPAVKAVKEVPALKDHSTFFGK
jgi:hypothetical protein